MKKLSKKQKRGLIYSIGAISISLFIFFLLTGDFNSLSVLGDLDIKYIGLLFVLVILFNVFNMIRLYFLAKSAGYSIGWINNFHYTVSGAFAGFITPMQTGGLPLQLYLSKKEDIPASAAMSIIVMRGVVAAMVFMLLLPFIFPFITTYFRNGSMKYLFIYFIGIYVFLGLLIVFLALFAERMEKKVKAKWKDGWLKKHTISLLSGVEGFTATTMGFFRKGPKNLFFAVFFSFLMVLMQSLMAPLILKSMGLEADMLKAAVLQFILIFLLSFSPTPGGAGIAEGSGWLLFKTVCPQESISIYIILWRFFTTIVNVLIGAIGFFIFLKEEDKDV